MFHLKKEIEKDYQGSHSCIDMILEEINGTFFVKFKLDQVKQALCTHKKDVLRVIDFKKNLATLQRRLDDFEYYKKIAEKVIGKTGVLGEVWRKSYSKKGLILSPFFYAECPLWQIILGVIQYADKGGKICWDCQSCFLIRKTVIYLRCLRVPFYLENIF